MVLPALLFAANMTIAVADAVPVFNVDPHCRAAASAGTAIREDFNKCRDAEQSARDELAKQWSAFAAADRSTCTRLSNIGGEPTYTALLTCLEMMRDARNLPKEPTDSTVGRRRQ